MGNKKYTDEELLNILRDAFSKNPRLTCDDFRATNGLPSYTNYRYRFGSFNNAKLLVGITNIHNSNNPRVSKYSDEELLDILRKHNKEIGFPNSRQFNGTNNLPYGKIYYERFGSFKNALKLADIEIPENRQKLFQRNNEYTYDDIKDEFDILVDLYLMDNVKLPPIKYFNNSDFVCETMLRRKYGDKKEIYKAMEYDYDEFNEVRMKEDMVNKYLEIKEILERLPNSRDIDRFAKDSNYYYGMTTYIRHFGNLSDLQKYIGETPTMLAKSITKEEIIDRLYKLKKEIQTIPTQIEINYCNYLPNTPTVLNKLNYDSICDLQLDLFGEKVEKANKYITKKGTKCLSTYEYIVAQILENNNYNFTKDDLYRNYIKTLKSKHSVDFVIHKDGKYYFIEVFGMMGIPKYEKKTIWKIQLCKDNNLLLLELYPKDISMSQFDELSDTIRKFTEN